MDTDIQARKTKLLIIGGVAGMGILILIGVSILNIRRSAPASSNTAQMLNYEREHATEREQLSERVQPSLVPSKQSELSLSETVYESPDRSYSFLVLDGWKTELCDLGIPPDKLVEAPLVVQPRDKEIYCNTGAAHDIVVSYIHDRDVSILLGEDEYCTKTITKKTYLGKEEATLVHTICDAPEFDSESKFILIPHAPKSGWYSTLLIRHHVEAPLIDFFINSLELH